MTLKNLTLSTTLMLLPMGSLLAVDGAILAKKCQSCHGVNYDKHALGESPDISRYSAKKLINELNEVREETPDDANARIMKEQIKGFSDAEIKAVAEYIAGHKKSSSSASGGIPMMHGGMSGRKMMSDRNHGRGMISGGMH